MGPLLTCTPSEASAVALVFRDHGGDRGLGVVSVRSGRAQNGTAKRSPLVACLACLSTHFLPASTHDGQTYPALTLSREL